MKKLTSILFFSFFISCVFAQDALTTGNRIFGGGLSFSHTDTENDNPYFYSNLSNIETRTISSSFSISPYYGRIYDDLKMVGIRFTYSGNDREFTWDDDFNATLEDISFKRFALGGFIRRYFPASDKFGGFLQSGIDLNRQITINRYRNEGLGDGVSTIIRRDEYESRAIGASIDATFGIYFFLLPQLSVETNLGQFLIAYDDIRIEESDQILDEAVERSGSSSSVDLNLINQFTFDKIFILNYYF